MRKCGLILLATLLALLTPVSCEVLSDWIHDDGVVARVGRHKLTLSQVEEIIPDGTSPEDSLNLALQYINSWASELLFSEVAAAQLTKSEQDVSRELEDYRHSLLKYRYEQRYLNERLDTVVSRNQIEQYYETHKDLFVLERPIVKSRFLDIMQESPYLEVLKGKMSSMDYEDVSQADSLAYSSALKYEDRSDRWIDMATEQPRQRMCLCQAGPLHYKVICCAGPYRGNTGMTMREFAELAASKDVRVAYNLDGGDSTWLYFRGQKVNEFGSNSQRKLMDIIYFASAENYVP